MGVKYYCPIQGYWSFEFAVPQFFRLVDAAQNRLKCIRINFKFLSRMSLGIYGIRFL